MQNIQKMGYYFCWKQRKHNIYSILVENREKCVKIKLT